MLLPHKFKYPSTWTQTKLKRLSFSFLPKVSFTIGSTIYKLLLYFAYNFYLTNQKMRITDDQKKEERDLKMNKYRMEIKKSLKIPKWMPKEEEASEQIRKNDRRKNSAFIETEELFKKKYEILEKLGEGTSGVVYSCRHISTGLIYALKIMQYETEQVQQFRQIFSAVNALEHESIIKYKAMYVCFHTNKIYLVMEDFPFEDLSLYQLKDEVEMRNVAQKLVSAVKYLHQNGICHRDIKPENILYDPLNKDIRLIDFNVSRITKIRKISKEMMTPTGTPNYRAPQTYTGSIYTENVDEWSIGVTLYKLVTGMEPFPFKNSIERTKKLSHFSQENLKGLFKEEIWKEYSVQCKDFIEKLLQPSNKRMSTEEASKHIWLTMNLEGRRLSRKDLFKISKKMTYTMEHTDLISEEDDIESEVDISLRLPEIPEMRKHSHSQKIFHDEEDHEQMSCMSKKIIKDDLKKGSSGNTYGSDSESLHYDSEDEIKEDEQNININVKGQKGGSDHLIASKENAKGPRRLSS